ncbi:hypothetical protein PR048_029594 [Dryococelus australis]|uniref:Uncharacterized protein n=1 Tax=Dryococelus australis TaxID=614101 RepID=A0ABQ9GGE2_9NEOP|nr:hypothetical protein PR048_029594 [Dryococelus australis]
MRLRNNIANSERCFHHAAVKTAVAEDVFREQQHSPVSLFPTGNCLHLADTLFRDGFGERKQRATKKKKKKTATRRVKSAKLSEHHNDVNSCSAEYGSMCANGNSNKRHFSRWNKYNRGNAENESNGSRMERLSDAGADRHLLLISITVPYNRRVRQPLAQGFRHVAYRPRLAAACILSRGPLLWLQLIAHRRYRQFAINWVLRKPLKHSPSTRRIAFDSRRCYSTEYCTWVSRRCSAGFLEDLPLYPPLHSGVAAHSDRYTFISTQDTGARNPDAKPHILLHSSEQGSIPDLATPVFSQVGIVPDDASDWRFNSHQTFQQLTEHKMNRSGRTVFGRAGIYVDTDIYVDTEIYDDTEIKRRGGSLMWQCPFAYSPRKSLEVGLVYDWPPRATICSLLAGLSADEQVTLCRLADGSLDILLAIVLACAARDRRTSICFASVLSNTLRHISPAIPENACCWPAVLNDALTSHSAILSTLEPQMFVHWLLLHRVANVTPHLAVRFVLTPTVNTCDSLTNTWRLITINTLRSADIYKTVSEDKLEMLGNESAPFHTFLYPLSMNYETDSSRSSHRRKGKAARASSDLTRTLQLSALVTDDQPIMNVVEHSSSFAVIMMEDMMDTGRCDYTTSSQRLLFVTTQQAVKDCAMIAREANASFNTAGQQQTFSGIAGEIRRRVFDNTEAKQMLVRRSRAAHANTIASNMSRLPSANRHKVTCSPADRPANREHIVARGGQSHTRPTSRDSRGQSAIGHRHIKEPQRRLISVSSQTPTQLNTDIWNEQHQPSASAYRRHFGMLRCPREKYKELMAAYVMIAGITYLPLQGSGKWFVGTQEPRSWPVQRTGIAKVFSWGLQIFPIGWRAGLRVIYQALFGERCFDILLASDAIFLHLRPELAVRETKNSLSFPGCGGGTVAERLARSPPTTANRVQYPAVSPDFRKWESRLTVPLVGGFSRGSPEMPEKPDELMQTTSQAMPRDILELVITYEVGLLKYLFKLLHNGDALT